MDTVVLRVPTGRSSGWHRAERPDLALVDTAAAVKGPQCPACVVPQAGKAVKEERQKMWRKHKE